MNHDTRRLIMRIPYPVLFCDVLPVIYYLNSSCENSVR